MTGTRRSRERHLDIGWHMALWAATFLLFCMTGVFAVAVVQDLVQDARPVAVDLRYLAAFGLALLVVVLFWRRYWFRPADLRRLVADEGGGGFRRRRGLWADSVEARFETLWMVGVLNRPIVDFWPAMDWFRGRPRELPEDMVGAAQISFYHLADLTDLPACTLEVQKARPARTGSPAFDAAVARATDALPDEGPVLRLEVTVDWLRVVVDGGVWMGSRFGDRIEQALGFARALVQGMGLDGRRHDPRGWTAVFRRGGYRIARIDRTGAARGVGEGGPHLAQAAWARSRPRQTLLPTRSGRAPSSPPL